MPLNAPKRLPAGARSMAKPLEPPPPLPALAGGPAGAPPGLPGIPAPPFRPDGAFFGIPPPRIFWADTQLPSASVAPNATAKKAPARSKRLVVVMRSSAEGAAAGGVSPGVFARAVPLYSQPGKAGGSIAGPAKTRRLPRLTAGRISF